MVFSWTANKTHNAQDVCRILVPPPNFGRLRGASDLWRFRDTPLQVLMPIARENKTPLEQVYYKRSAMEEGWLIDRDDCWIWRFHQDSTSGNKAGVFIDRGRKLPSGPPLLKERRHLTDRAAEQMWLSLQTQGWKPLEEPAWVARADV